MQGWVSLHRKILENPIVCKDSDYFSVWCYLLLNATHDSYDVEFKGKRITLEPGQLLTGRKSISSKFNINESKVQRILKKLEIEHQIEQQTGNKNRLITVLNWSLYQGSEQHIEQQVNNKRTTSEQQVNTNNNVITKQQNNEDKIKYIPDSYEYRIADYLYQSMLNNNPTAKQPNLQSWAKHIDYMIRIDKRPIEEIGRIIDFSQKDTFWQSNILSTKKLREKYDTLKLQMKRPAQTQQQPTKGLTALQRYAERHGIVNE